MLYFIKLRLTTLTRMQRITLKQKNQPPVVISGSHKSCKQPAKKASAIPGDNKGPVFSLTMVVSLRVLSGKWSALNVPLAGHGSPPPGRCDVVYSGQ